MKKFPSQHLNHYTLKELATRLRPAWKNKEIVEIFSQSKDELVLEIAVPLFPYLRISNLPAFSFVVPLEEFHKKKANVARLFPEIYGKKILDLEVLQGERILVISLEENFKLVLKFFGTHSNVLVLQDEKVLDVFRKKLSADYDFSLKNFQKDFSFPETISKENLKTYFPALDKLLTEILEKKFEFPVSTTSLLRFIEKEIQAPPYYLSEEGKFFLVEPPGLKIIREHKHLIPALQDFVKNYWQKKSFSELYAAAKKVLREKLKAARKKIKSLEKHIRKLESLPDYKQWADILLANAYDIEKNKDREVSLYDFYNDKQVKIPINPDLSVAENAEKLYKKQKKIQGQLENARQQILVYRNLEQELFKKLSELEKIKDYKILKKWTKANTELLRSSGKNQGENKNYKEFSFRGYRILLGKSGLSNDELLRLAKKEDLWFHVKDGTGSHVIVIKQGKEKLPEEVKEFAASLAAYHSKSKHSKWVLVRYTPRKYLRKAKRLARGQVLVDREETMLVSPDYWKQVL